MNNRIFKAPPGIQRQTNHSLTRTATVNEYRSEWCCKFTCSLYTVAYILDHFFINSLYVHSYIQIYVCCRCECMHGLNNRGQKRLAKTNSVGGVKVGLLKESRSLVPCCVLSLIPAVLVTQLSFPQPRDRHSILYNSCKFVLPCPCMFKVNIKSKSTLFTYDLLNL